MYRIPEDNLSALSEKIEKANKRAKKLGVPGLSFKITGDETEYWAVNYLESYSEKKVSADYEPQFGERKIVRIYKLVDLSGEAPKYANWEFIASINHGEYSTVRTIPGLECPAEQRERGNVCDHCGISRYRTDTFIVKNTKSGEYKQVGRTCLADFLGSMSDNPEHIGQWFIWLHKFMGGFEEEYSHLPHAEPMYPIADVLEVTAKVIKVSGWLSRGKARDNGGKPTADTVRDYLSGYLWRIADRWAKEGREKIQSAVVNSDEIQLSLDWAKNLAGTSDYERNIKIMAGAKNVKESDFGFVASILPAYRRAVPKTEEKKDKSLSNWLGTEGEKITVTVTVLGFKELKTDFGLTILYSMKDSAGNIIKWFTGKTDLIEGNTYTLTATVKKHTEYNSQKETLITRAKVA